MMKTIVGEIEICRGIPKSLGDEKLHALAMGNRDINVSRFVSDVEPLKIKNRVLYTGKQLLLHKIFFNTAFELNKIYAGDGAASFFGGEPFNFSFPNQEYPVVAEQVKGHVFSNSIVNVGDVTDLDGERSRGFAALIQSDLHQTGAFDGDNTNFYVNNLSIVATGVDTPAIGPFSIGDEIPFSNATIPKMEMNPGAPAVLYINWIFRLI